MPVYKSKQVGGGGGGTGIPPFAATSYVGCYYLEASGLIRRGDTSVTFVAGTDLTNARVGYYVVTRAYRAPASRGQQVIRGNFFSKITAIDLDTLTVTFEDGYDIIGNTQSFPYAIGPTYRWHIAPLVGVGAEIDIPAGLSHLLVTGYGTTFSTSGASNLSINDIDPYDDRFQGGLDVDLGYYYTLGGEGIWRNRSVQGDAGVTPEPVGIGAVEERGTGAKYFELQYKIREGKLTIADLTPDDTRNLHEGMFGNIYLSGR